MENKKIKNYKKYYIIGGVLLLINIILLLLAISCSIIYKENQTIGWISFVVVSISLIMIFFSIYLLKKANFLRLNYLLSKDNAKYLKNK